MLNVINTLNGSSVDPLQNLGVRAQVPKNKNVHILNLRDLTRFHFDRPQFRISGTTQMKGSYSINHNTICINVRNKQKLFGGYIDIVSLAPYFGNSPPPSVPSAIDSVLNETRSSADADNRLDAFSGQ